MISDEEFWAAHAAVAQQAFSAPNVVMQQADIDIYASIMVEFAESTDDPGAWRFIIARMDDFVRRGHYPPISFIKAINAALKRWNGGENLDYIFGVSKVGRGRRESGLLDRGWQDTNAHMMAFHISKGASEEQAASMVAEFRARASENGEAESVSTIKRHYKRLFKK
ncbi:hypothetical protein [Sterolibacterium denitrificans]|uniref:hypothetical protein n=1 Tax=Sterolibacterium denitrificans TaxID=157592 RepID=UPI0012B6A3C2|nr:hypothetical protein [Sterolibacterium denitrificans]